MMQCREYMSKISVPEWLLVSHEMVQAEKRAIVCTRRLDALYYLKDEHAQNGLCHNSTFS